jgi:toxin ParE1/3/4
MRRLIIRPSVVEGLEGIPDYLAARNLDAAERFLDACRLEFSRLADMPGMGRIREFEHPKAAGIRSRPISGFKSYLVFYRPIEDSAEILHVIHGARDIDAIFGSQQDG